jgi:hypothetical protein
MADQVEALVRAQAALLEDLRFEHLGRKVDDIVWHFAADCYVDKGQDRVRSFVDQHGREPMDLVCYIPVENLKVAAETEMLGIRLLPVNDPRVPPARPEFSLEVPIGCVAAVGVRGTSYERMAQRARAVASHALRVLRVAPREHTGIHDRQLRFRLGIAYAFDERLSGWRQREDEAYELEFSGNLIELALAQPVARMPAEPTNDIQRKADLALRWMERAWFATEPLVALLYLFFALEALLGDKSEKLKAHGLAFQQAMLSHAVTGSFTHPNETYFLYDQVRSGAVHGEDAPEVSWDIVHSFAGDVRGALNQYLTYADEQGFQRRGRLLKALDEHPDRPQLVAWLRQNGGSVWSGHLQVEDSEGAPAGGHDG